MTFPKNSGSDCSSAWDAMPWVLQESASQEQNDWLMEHLAQCAACSAEFEQQRRLRLALSLPSDIPVDANAGLARLLNRLDSPEVETPLARPRASGWLMRALVAAVLVQALGIGMLGAKLWSEGANPSYRTLSQASLPVPAGAIHVVPEASMKLADWDALLRTLRLQVVGGPNDVGAYTVVSTGSVAAQGQTLQQLRASRGIRLAEPVNDTP